jgi:mannose-6-phosphate isomerase
MGNPPLFYPLTFQPIFKERVWGGRNLARLYRKPLPPNVPIGESWELTDRPEGVSVVANGPLTGQTLRWLMEQHGPALLGPAHAPNGRFPLLVKILDAEDRLSLQVHPPASIAARLGGEPKTEMWYVAETRPGAELFAGLRRGTSRAEFEQRLRDGTVANCFHRIPVEPGDALFLPSGRVHALGAGNVIFEIQQNSDTTYRVFDWNRVGLDGRPRQLHVAQSLQCIDFGDFTPPLVSAEWSAQGGVQVRRLVTDALFTVDEVRSSRPVTFPVTAGTATILGVLDGSLDVQGGGEAVTVPAGGFCLLPACLKEPVIRLQEDTAVLRVVPG